jgi:hypothetical protein
MNRKAWLLLEAEPFHSAAGAINAWVEEELKGLGFHTERHNHARTSARDAAMPLGNARRLLHLRGQPTADLAVYCDMGLGIHAPDPKLARRTLVYFHGLHGAPTTWLGNPLIDRYMALSPYVQDVLEALLATPDWSQRQCLEPRGPRVVDYVVPSLPCLEAPAGETRMPGGELPPEVQQALERGEVLGHAVQPGKADWVAVCSILLNLHALAREHGRPPFRLVVAAQDFDTLQHALRYGHPADASALGAAMSAFGVRLEDLLLPVAHLSQPALFRLFKSARFGLCYNVYPEPFGLYVLESVLNGCPIYTNGAGNNRHALPPGHGINVLETPDMAFGNPGAYAEVAARIFQDVSTPGTHEQACQRGAELVRRTFTREAFSESFRACLSRMEEQVAPVPFDERVVRLSPMVRRMDESTGQVASDYIHTVLSPDELRVMHEALGQPARALGHEGEAGLALLQGLFDKGVLTLDAPPGLRAPGTLAAGSWYAPGH